MQRKPRPVLVTDFSEADIARCTHALFGVTPVDMRELQSLEELYTQTPATSTLWRDLTAQMHAMPRRLELRTSRRHDDDDNGGGGGIATTAEFLEQTRLFDDITQAAPFTLAIYEQQLLFWMRGAENYATKMTAPSALHQLWWCFEFYTLDHNNGGGSGDDVRALVRNGLSVLVRCLYCVRARALGDANYDAAADAQRLYALLRDSTERCFEHINAAVVAHGVTQLSV